MHPEIARRSCDDCIRFMYDDTPQRMGEIRLRGGEPIPRLKSQKPSCGWCPKIPRGVEPRPSNAVELSEKNHQAYLFHVECRAVRSWPDDPIVRRNAAIIERVEAMARDEQQSDLIALAVSRVSGRL